MGMPLDYNKMIKISFSNKLPFISAGGNVTDVSNCHGLVSFYKKNREPREEIHGLFLGA